MKFHDGTRRNATSNRGSASSRGPRDTMMPATSEEREDPEHPAPARRPLPRERDDGDDGQHERHDAGVHGPAGGHVDPGEEVIGRRREEQHLVERPARARHGPAQQEPLQEEQEARQRPGRRRRRAPPGRTGSRDDHHRRHPARSHAPWTRSGRARAAATSRPGRSRPRPRGAMAGTPRGSGARPRVGSVTTPAARSQAASACQIASARSATTAPIARRTGSGSCQPWRARAPSAP